MVHHTFEDWMLKDSPSIWVFGYGSLMWKPDFDYCSKVTGRIRGFQRRFWQGSNSHRGTEKQIGRVATLVEDSAESHVWGLAFQISGEKSIRKVMGGLTSREITLGGYAVIRTPFYPRDGSQCEVKDVFVFMATPDNELFVGDVDLDTMATQVVTARGFAGTNAEYVTRTADYVRQHIPEDNDDHLFSLDRKIQELMSRFQSLGGRLKTDKYDSDGETDESDMDESDEDVADGTGTETEVTLYPKSDTH